MTISKDSGAQDLGYETMRLDALALVQKLSGNLWTDYNAHDPGVTLLEEIVFALTELGYKANFEIEDFLTSRKGEIDLNREALYSPEQVKEAFPVTPGDYSRFFSSRVEGVARMDFQAVDMGFYAVRIVPRKMDGENRDDAEKSIRESFDKLWRDWRILGERVSSLEFDWNEDVARTVAEKTDSLPAKGSCIYHEHRDVLYFAPIIEQFPTIYRAGENGKSLQKFLEPLEFLFKGFLDSLDNFADCFSIDVLKTSFENYDKILNQMLAIYGVEFPSALFNKIHGNPENSVSVRLLRAKVLFIRQLPNLQMHRCGTLFRKRLEIMLGMKVVVADGVYIDGCFGKVLVAWGNAGVFDCDLRSEVEHFVREELPAHLIPVFYWVPEPIPEEIEDSFFKERERYMSESLWV